MYFIYYILLYVYYIVYFCCMKTTFMQEHLVINYDDHIHYMVIIELVDYVPVRSFIVRMPAPCTQFAWNMYLMN